jgi:hypothetical protein
LREEQRLAENCLDFLGETQALSSLCKKILKTENLSLAVKE